VRRGTLRPAGAGAGVLRHAAAPPHGRASASAGRRTRPARRAGL
ncbi:MAG: hypothetical protein AVDCRST_MAG89-2342, partial [uncultured Gemmatimonadetes bacterium]